MSDRTCIEPGCDRTWNANRLCNRHRMAYIRHGRELPQGRPRRRISIDDIRELAEQGENLEAVARSLQFTEKSILAAAYKAGDADLVRQLRRRTPPPMTPEQEQDRAYRRLVHHPDHEKRLCRDDWHQWDGPADGETAASWWEYRGKDASLACMRCPVLEQCAQWRRSGAVVTGVLAGVPLDEGKPVDVTSRRKRGNGEVAA